LHLHLIVRANIFGSKQTKPNQTKPNQIMSVSQSAVGAGDNVSEYGGMFEQESVLRASSDDTTVGHGRAAGAGHRGERSSPGVPASGLTRDVPAVVGGFGRGPVAPDLRKFRYDVNRARTRPAMAFGASRADRMDTVQAGDLLHRIHVVYGIDREPEERIAAFDKALFWEHTVNGASLMQPGRGFLFAGEASFDLSVVKTLLGVDQRRFFRAFSDEIADVNREVVASFDPYDAAAAEKHGQLMQVAVERGLQKYPHLSHDSSDAGARLSVEERVAVIASKRLVLPSATNNADKLAPRAGQAAAPAGMGSAGASAS